MSNATERPTEILELAVVKMAGDGIEADFIPPLENRSIAEASNEEVFKHYDEIEREYDGLLTLLAQ